MFRAILFFVFSFALLINAIGQKYFQQEVDYYINVKLNDNTHSLSGNISIHYQNKSPDTLKFIYFHIWPNAYSSEKTALAKQMLAHGNQAIYMSSISDLGYIDSLSFVAGNEKASFEYHPEHPDICILFLPKPLVPGGKTIIETPFFVKIPDNKLSRLGHDGNAYQITQWYPKPAVYDNEGWHPMPYLDMGEFYSEFGSFDVSITLPENYIVAATGNLQTESEKKWLNQKAEDTEKYLPFMIKNKNLSFPASSNKMKTIRFTEDKIHDFAWFADKRFNVLKDSVSIPGLEKCVYTWLMFTSNEAEIWINGQAHIKNAISFYSEKLGNYPYHNCTAIESMSNVGGGMEYPGITLIGEVFDNNGFEELVLHEVGHNWIYGILANNERKYPWLDEGLNTFYEMRYFLEKHPDKKFYQYYDLNYFFAKFLKLETFPYYFNYYLITNYIDRKGENQPLNLSSEEYSPLNYWVGIYNKTALHFLHLLNYLGVEEFDKIMKIYYEQNSFKHVCPESIKQVFYKNASKKTCWFFEQLINTDYLFDYAVTKSEKQETGFDISIKNKGIACPPLPLSLYRNDSLVYSGWIEGFKGKKKVKFGEIDFDRIVIDPDYFTADLNRGNNSIRTKGFLKKARPLSLKWFGAYEDHKERFLFFTPLLAYNYYDKFMPGIILYNTFVQQKPLQFFLMPFYSHFRQRKNNSYIHGEAKISLRLPVKSSSIKNIVLQSSAKRYGLNGNTNFNSINSGAIINLATSYNKNSKLQLVHYLATDLEQQTYFDTSYLRNYSSISYKFENNRYKDPWNFSLGLEQSSGYIKSTFTANYRFSWRPLEKGLDLRFFAGTFLYSSTDYYGNYNFRLSGWNGYADYLFQNIYPGRLENFTASGDNNILSRQFSTEDGGFAIFSPYSTNRWMMSINYTFDLPFTLPINIYGSVGLFNYYQIAENVRTTQNAVEYEVGIEIKLIKDICSVYFPVHLSKNLKIYSNMVTNNYLQKVRFTLNLTRIKPFEYLQNIEF